MTKKLTLALVAAAAVGMASPAFSQASLPNTSSLGTGSLLPYAYPITSDSSAPITTENSARQANARAVRGDVVTTGALGAFAAEPNHNWNSSVDSPAAAGGGNFGYNQNLDNPNY